MGEHAEEPIADVLCVEEAHGQVYFLVINYYRNDPAHAAGYLFERAAGTDEAARNILATNDTLRTLWCSPSGSLWLTSTTGLVWTTANVPWPQDVTEPDLEFDTPEGNLVWRHGALPRQAHDDLAPNATSIWGFDDGDVYVGSFGGVVYHWDGKSWSQYFSGLAGSIGAVRGRARNDVYAVGYNSTILHFDGSSWKIVADPDGEGTNDILTGSKYGMLSLETSLVQLYLNGFISYEQVLGKAQDPQAAIQLIGGQKPISKR